MNNSALHQNLIKTIREKLPEKANMATTLMELLPLGKEATYRRLRGEVPFTFEEIVSLSRQLGFSIDRITGSNLKNESLFDFYAIPDGESIECYSDMTEHYIEFLRQLKNPQDMRQAGSTNFIPQIFALTHPSLARFKRFKWIYQRERTGINKKFHEMETPEAWTKSIEELCCLCRDINLTFDIWDNNVIADLINDISYFTRIGLIRKSDIKNIWDDMESLLAEMEEVALKGEMKEDNPVQIYVSHVNFDATYGYLERNNFQLSFVRVFEVNSITSLDASILNIVKDWILSLKKFSTLISESGEVQRVEFFKHQRELIHASRDTLFP